MYHEHRHLIQDFNTESHLVAILGFKTTAITINWMWKKMFFQDTSVWSRICINKLTSQLIQSLFTAVGMLTSKVKKKKQEQGKGLRKVD